MYIYRKKLCVLAVVYDVAVIPWDILIMHGWKSYIATLKLKISGRCTLMDLPFTVNSLVSIYLTNQNHIKALVPNNFLSINIIYGLYYLSIYIDHAWESTCGSWGTHHMWMKMLKYINNSPST